jgi:hypothetical protein
MHSHAVLVLAGKDFNSESGAGQVAAFGLLAQSRYGQTTRDEWKG